MNKTPMFQHRLPNGKIIMHTGLPKHLAIKRMEDHERWCQEHREELERDSQELFDQMFGGWCKQLVSRPNQLARWHSDPSRSPNPMLIIGAWTKHSSPIPRPCRTCRISCLTPWCPQKCVLIGSAIVSMSLQLMRSLILLLMLTSECSLINDWNHGN